MAGKTTNYNLPTLEGTDQIAIVNDYNALANGVDSALKTVEDKTAPSTITTTSGSFVTGVTPTTKAVTTYADLDAHPTLLSGVSAATGKAITGVTLNS